ncbi:hypothetical protein KPH14_010682 [Odynerus spinipes]|uniref:Uncharacterized protein n=1 Tax=Odynerus spinipes TaxID=1348599 RepID=A0AAD9RUW0_9HYME|nr:hypothetical protein KPH14_010682 [Odynerus spinipes]
MATVKKIVLFFLILWQSENSHQRISDPVDVVDTPAPKLNDKEISSRERRALIFPDPSTLLLIFGLGTPLQLDRESVIVGLFIKMIWALPTNGTDFTEPGVYYTRGTKSRWSIYKILEKVAAIYGFGGKACLLRAICEAANVPFDVHHGLFGQLVQLFLRPSSTEEEYDEYGDREYRAAERLGEQVAGENCHALYPECRRSLLDVFSTVVPV